MSVIFLFIDGVGLGEESDVNPFAGNDYPGFSAITGGPALTKKAKSITTESHLFMGVDATLGVEGLPQSGTGQATLFSGENAPKMIGKHFGPFPHSGTKHLLEEQSLFLKVQDEEKKSTFINGYPDIFFEKANKRNRWSCTTLMTKSAGISLHTIEEVKKEKAVTAGLTQRAWKEQLNLDVPVISPEEAADRLINQSVSYDLLLHEYYLTDKAGHNQDKEQAHRVIKRYDRFLWQLIKQKSANTTLVLCSDHGNVEDLSIKTHTFNNVPLFVLGPGAKHFTSAKSIQDVTPGILEALREN